jgi:2'-5' RNA ligase
MDGFCGEGTAINSFSLVAYLPERLGGFIDRLRQEVQPGCRASAHVTVLPPRPLTCSSAEAMAEIESALRDWQVFQVSLLDVCVFPVTQVIHLSVGDGCAELKRLHGVLNSNCLRFAENFEYQPHVTLAQNLNVEQIAHAAALAHSCWQEFRQPHIFWLDCLTLVQNTTNDRWNTVREFPLRTPVGAGLG